MVTMQAQHINPTSSRNSSHPWLYTDMQPICSTTFLHVILTPGSGQAVQTGASATGASEPGQKSFPSTGEGTTPLREGVNRMKGRAAVRLREQTQSLASPGMLLPHWAHALEQCVPAL